jgi:hypothetical protein
MRESVKIPLHEPTLSFVVSGDDFTIRGDDKRRSWFFKAELGIMGYLPPPPSSARDTDLRVCEAALTLSPIDNYGRTGKANAGRPDCSFGI